MKSYSLFLLVTILMCPELSHSQNTFKIFYMDTLATGTNGAIEDDGGNIITTISKKSGPTFSSSEIHSGIILTIDPIGDTTIKRFSFGDTLFSFTHFFKLNTEGYLISGKAIAPGSDSYLFMIMRIDDELNKVWRKFYDFPDDYRFYISKAYEVPTGIIMAGTMSHFQSAGKTPFLLRINKEGDILAQYHYDDSSSSTFDFLLSSDSSEIWCFCSYGMDPINGPSLTAFDTSFNYLYSRVIPKYSMHSFDALWYSDTTFLLAYDGQRPGAPYQDDEHFVNMYDTSLNLLYTNYFGAPDTSDYPAWRQSVDFRHPDSIFFAGWKNHDLGYPSPNVVSWIMTGQLDSTLQPRYLHFMGGDAYYETYYILATSDGGSLICAGKWDPDKEVFDLLFMKLNSEGLILGTAPPGIEIRQALVYPNPATDWLTVETVLQNATLNIFNLSGKLLMTPPLAIGNTTINIESLRPGTYIYTITNQKGEIENGKFIKQ